MNIILNLVGLCFDITGVILLYRYGLIAELNEAILGSETIFKDLSNDEVKKSKNLVTKSKLAFISLILGFSFQFASSAIQLIPSEEKKEIHNYCKDEKCSHVNCKCHSNS